MFELLPYYVTWLSSRISNVYIAGLNYNCIEIGLHDFYTPQTMDTMQNLESITHIAEKKICMNVAVGLLNAEFGEAHPNIAKKRRIFTFKLVPQGLKVGSM